jgi:tRNA A-37 threonylcarbamoyl transferase component Bud32
MTTSLEQRLHTSLAGRYAIEREVGRGGMATVFLAHDIRHDRRVAVKVLEPELGAVLGAERFLAEIKVTANLQHPNLLPLFDSGDADGLLFYVMPFVEGESLRARLDRESPLPIDDAVAITIAVAKGLEYAHKQGVIHRDLKPENILLREGQPVIADFGIALAVSKAGGARITQTGLSLGTPQYMSPEQATGDRGVDARSDIYSLGAMSYEMLTGEPPHVGTSSQAIIGKLMTEDVRPVTVLRRNVPPHVDAAVRHALEKLAADRFATAGEFAAALQGTGDAASLRRYTASGGASDATAAIRRSRLQSRVAWALVALLAAAFAWAWRKPSEIPETPVVRMHLDVPAGDRVMVNGFPLALSPRGDRVAYVIQGASGYATHVRRLNELTGKAVAAQALPGLTFSPDGKWLAYIDGKAVKKMPADGGQSITVATFDVGPGALSWGVPETIVVGTRKGVWTVSSSGGTARVVAGSDSGTAQDGLAALPDGKTVIYASGSTAADLPLKLMTLGSGESTLLGVNGMQPLGVLEGNLIYLTRAGTLMAVPLDVSRRKVTGDPVQIEDGVGGAAISRSGALAFKTGQLANRMVMASTGKEDVVLLSEPKNYKTPRLSPDGKRIAVAVEGASGSDIWVYDIGAHTFTRLTSEGDNWSPEWSPDGSRIVFTSDRGNERTVWWQPADGSARAELLHAADVATNEGLISPDGKWLIYRTGPTAAHPRDIFAVPMSGEKKPLALVEGPASEIMPRVSPDGRWLAYQSDESGRFEIYARPFPNNGARVQVSTQGGTEPLWSRSGNTMYYRTTAGIIAASVTTNPTFAIGERQRVLISDFPPDPTHAGYDVTPDGKQFLIMKSAGEQSQAVLVLNWKRELREKLATRK